MLKKVEIVSYEGINILVVDNEGFDWSFDEKSLQKAIKNDPTAKESVIGNIQKHFIKSFSEFIGREITFDEINKAIVEGFIEA